MHEADEARLAALAGYAILDTPAETGFDDIVRIAATICAAPVALISLVDRRRQWFKARVGFDPGETPIDQSVCVHALNRTDLLVIPDLTADPRTKTNPLVAGEPFLRFYAGAPLVAPGGAVLGTLCIIDHAARPEGLTPSQAQTLEALARQVMTQLELRRAIAERDAARDRTAAEEAKARADAARLEALIETQRVVASAGADIDIVFRAIADGALSVIDRANGAVVEILDGRELVYHTASGTSASRRGTRLPIAGTLSGRAVGTGTSLVCLDTHDDAASEYAVARAFGVRSMIVSPILREGAVIGVLKVQSGEPGAFDARDVMMSQMLAGLVSSGLGEAAEARTRRTLRDVENRYRQVFDSAVEFAIVVTNVEGRITDWNVGAERVFGWTAEEMLGSTVERFFTPTDRAAGRIEMETREARQAGRAADERWHLRKDGSLFWGSGELMPLRGDAGEHLGYVKILRDRTQEHEAGRKLQDTEARLRQAQAAGGVGIFSVDVRTSMVECTPEFCRLYGLSENERMPATEFETLVVPEDKALASDHETRLASSAPADVVYRIRRADTGELRWIARKGEFETDADGRPVRFVGAARDISDQVLARRQLDDEREQLAQMFAQAPTFMALLRGPDHRFERVNPGYVRLIGGRDVLGRTVAEGLADAASQGFVEILDQVYRTGEAFVATEALYAMQVEAGGPVDQRFVDFVFQPIRNAAGEVTGIFVEGADVTDRARAAAALRETQDRYRALVENVDIGICIVDVVFDETGKAVDYVFLAANAALERQSGIVGAVGRRMREIVPNHEQHWFDTYGEVARSGKPARFEQGAMGLDDRWFDVHAIRVGAPSEHRVAILFTDITERRLAEQQIAAAERRYRQLFNSIDEGFCLIEMMFDEAGEPLDYLFLETNKSFERQTGLVGPQGRTARELVPDLERFWFETYGRVATSGEPVRFRNLAAPMEKRWFDVSAFRLDDARPNQVGILFADVSDEVASEERRQVLNAELAHRLKNTLAIVSSIATQTLRSATDIPTARKVLTDRIQALSKAHDILLTGQSDAASIGAIVRSAVALHDEGGRVETRGAELTLGPKAALTLSLIVHELATNAGKYGSLSVPGGRVLVDWSQRPDEATGRPRLIFQWREVDGPPVSVPTRRSFGTRLIGMGLSGASDGSVDMQYAPDGLCCRIEAALSELQSQEDDRS